MTNCSADFADTIGSSAAKAPHHWGWSLTRRANQAAVVKRWQPWLAAAPAHRAKDDRSRLIRSQHAAITADVWLARRLGEKSAPG